MNKDATGIRVETQVQRAVKALGGGRSSVRVTPNYVRRKHTWREQTQFYDTRKFPSKVDTSGIEYHCEVVTEIPIPVEELRKAVEGTQTVIACVVPAELVSIGVNAEVYYSGLEVPTEITRSHIYRKLEVFVNKLPMGIKHVLGKKVVRALSCTSETLCYAVRLHTWTKKLEPNQVMILGNPDIEIINLRTHERRNTWRMTQGWLQKIL